MACTCTEDKEVIGNVIIGRNKVECAECLATRTAYEARKAKEDEIADKKDKLARTDYKVLRQYEKGTLSQAEWDELKEQRHQLRQRINELEAQL